MRVRAGDVTGTIPRERSASPAAGPALLRRASLQLDNTMTNDAFTAEALRAHANGVAAKGLPREAEMLRAYADLLEQRASGVTDEVVAKAAHAYLGEHVGFGHGCDLSQLRDALEAVWPIVAKPVAQAEAVYQRHLAVPGYWEDITREQRAKAQRGDTRVLYIAQPRAVPDGWVLVPRELTDRMLDRAVAFALNVEVGGGYGWSDYMRDVWARMLAAAPQPGEPS